MGRQQDKLFAQIANLKFTAKRLTRQAAKCEKEETACMAKVMLGIQKGDMTSCETHAQSAIRKRNERLTMASLSARITGVVGKLSHQTQVDEVVAGMASITRSLGCVAGGERVTNVMSEFARLCEDLDTREEVVGSALAKSVAGTAPDNDVLLLIQRVADTHGLELAESMPSCRAHNAVVPALALPAAAKPLLLVDDSDGLCADLTARFAALKR
jgi:charged multivesicular body protein 1